jgi:hypothetical protein
MANVRRQHNGPASTGRFPTTEHYGGTRRPPVDECVPRQLALHSEVFVMSPRHAVTNVRGQYTWIRGGRFTPEGRVPADPRQCALRLFDSDSRRSTAILADRSQRKTATPGGDVAQRVAQRLSSSPTGVMMQAVIMRDEVAVVTVLLTQPRGHQLADRRQNGPLRSTQGH